MCTKRVESPDSAIPRRCCGSPRPGLPRDSAPHPGAPPAEIWWTGCVPLISWIKPWYLENVSHNERMNQWTRRKWKLVLLCFVAKNLRSWRSLCGRSFHFLPWVVLWRVPEFWMCVQGFARQEYLKLITSDRVLGRFSQGLWINTCTLLAMRSGVLSISSTPQTQEKDGQMLLPVPRTWIWHDMTWISKLPDRNMEKLELQVIWTCPEMGKWPLTMGFWGALLLHKAIFEFIWKPTNHHEKTPYCLQPKAQLGFWKWGSSSLLRIPSLQLWVFVYRHWCDTGAIKPH